ncbi:MAG: c-type cytochrome [Rubripirellula sp.]
MLANLTSSMFVLGDYAASEYAWFPENASTFAADNDWLFGIISVVCVIFFVPIAFALFYFAWKYKKPKGAPAESDTAHNTPLELAWSIGPSFFLVGMFIFGAKAYLDHRTVPDGANEIKLQGKTWAWSFDYGGGAIHPELHILIDEPTKLSMTSNDVIHSVFIPAFRAKKDVVPGRYNYMWFKPTVASEKVTDAKLKEALDATADAEWDYDRWQFTKDGYRFFDLYCTEYCGDNHSQMQTVVVVHDTLDELNAWIEKISKRDPKEYTKAQYGKLLYEQRGCKSCHSLDGKRIIGPSFKESYGNQRSLSTGEAVIADENYIRESILYPKAKIVAGYPPVMPSYKGQLLDDDIDSLVEYLKTISDYTPAVASKEEDAAEDNSAAADSEPEPTTAEE